MLEDLLSKSEIKAFLLATLIGIIGAIFANIAGMPLPWLLGSLLATALGSLIISNTNLQKTITIAVPSSFRFVLLAILGGLLGRGFNPHAFENMSNIPITVGFLALLAISITLVSFLLYYYFLKTSGVTAFLSSVPGGMSEMVSLVEQQKGDARVAILSHSMRLTLILTSIPYLVLNIGSFEEITMPSTNLWLPKDYLTIAFCILCGSFIGHKLKLPSGHMFGAMILSAIAYFSGIITTYPPPIILIVIQLFLGTSMGSRFYGYKIKQVFFVMLMATVAATFTIAFTAFFAFLASRFSGVDFLTLLVSYAPGGMSEMALVALSLHMDPGFVTIHHILRWVATIILTPALIVVWGKYFIKNK